jgi:hypothetical protein
MKSMMKRIKLKKKLIYWSEMINAEVRRNIDFKTKK